LSLRKISVDKEPDLSNQILGLTFKSPILVSSSEATSNTEQIRNLIRAHVGGIISKTYTSPPEYRIRVRPYQFPLNRFGASYARGGCLYSLAAPHVEDPEKVKHLLAEIISLCKKSSVIFTVSFFEDPQDYDLWIRRASEFETMGADMVELNFSSPSASRIFSKSFDSAGRIIAGIKKKTRLPIGLKLSPTLEPLEAFVKICVDNGLDFITAHNAPAGILIDVDKEVPFGAPSLGGYVMGRTFLPYSLGRIVRIRQVAGDIPVIGVGGIYEAEDALQYLLCGCPLVGVGSAIYFKGPQVLSSMHKGILEWMHNKNYDQIDRFRGKAFLHIKDSAAIKIKEPHPYTLPPECPWVPEIDQTLCTGCGACQAQCVYGVLTMEERGGKVTVNEDKCWSCGFCVGICPSNAIRLVDRSNRDRIIWQNQGMAELFHDQTSVESGD
jgi:dihydroorotate dehydrogenase/ferredoxin